MKAAGRPAPAHIPPFSSSASGEESGTAYGHAGGRRPRLPGLDLLRAAAIICVLFAHDTAIVPQWFGISVPVWFYSYGLVGVDLFFALSGYLIGQIILDIVSSRPSLRDWKVFLIRRWMRTMPLYYAVMLVLLAVSPPVSRIGYNVVLYATFAQNLLTPIPPENWNSVTWSLTVEEWFYLLFGSAAILGTRLIGRHLAIGLALLALLIIPTLCRWYFLTPGIFALAAGTIVIHRLDGIAFGVLLAILQRQGSLLFRYPVLFFLMGLGLILHLQLFPTPLYPQQFRTYIFTLWQVGASLCLPLMVRIRALPGFLGRPVLALSNQAYGLYLMHMPILELTSRAVTGKTIGPWAGVLIVVIVPLVLSWLSFHYLETPFLALRPKQRQAASL